MPQSLTTVQYLRGSERQPLYYYASRRLQSSAGHQIHLMTEERTYLQSEKRETPNHCFGNNDLLQEAPTLRPQRESTPTLLRPPRLVAENECHPPTSLFPSDAVLSPDELPLFFSKKDF